MREGFFDSNVLLYTLAAGDPRAAVAIDLLAQGGSISVQVLNEFASVAHRKLGLSWPEVAAALMALRVFCAAPLPLTAATHDAALRVAARYQVSFYDALIVASALEAGCTTLWSEDLHTGLVIDGRVTVRNPFAPA